MHHGLPDDACVCVCLFPRYSAYGRARHGQGDPGPVPGAATSQGHGGPLGRIIRDHHSHRQALWRQRQPSTLHTEWVTQQLTQPPTANEWLPGIARQHIIEKMTVCWQAVLFCMHTYVYSNCVSYLLLRSQYTLTIQEPNTVCKYFITVCFAGLGVPDWCGFTSLERCSISSELSVTVK